MSLYVTLNRAILLVDEQNEKNEKYEKKILLTCFCGRGRGRGRRVARFALFALFATFRDRVGFDQELENVTGVVAVGGVAFGNGQREGGEAVALAGGRVDVGAAVDQHFHRFRVHAVDCPAQRGVVKAVAGGG
jgi:hypothetical protein